MLKKLENCEKKIISYPWLYELYNKIVSCQLNLKIFKFNLIISYSVDLNVDFLVFNLVKWLMCNFVTDNFFCNICINCKLLNLHQHPDFYFIKCENKNICINDFILIKNKLYERAYLSSFKIVYFSYTNFLTKTTFNSLLKTMEEFSYKIIFIFTCFDNVDIPLTLLSRSFFFKLFNPSERVVFTWLKNFNFSLNNDNILSVIRLNNNSPFLSLNFIKYLWKKRLSFLNKISFSLFSNLDKIQKLIYNNFYLKFNWLLILFMDLVNLHFNNKDSIVNIDHLLLLKCLYKKFLFKNIYIIIKKIIIYQREILLTPNLNKNLLINNISFVLHQYSTCK